MQFSFTFSEFFGQHKTCTMEQSSHPWSIQFLGFQRFRPCDSPQRAPHFGHGALLDSKSEPSPVAASVHHRGLWIWTRNPQAELTKHSQIYSGANPAMSMAENPKFDFDFHYHITHITTAGFAEVMDATPRNSYRRPIPAFCSQ